MQLMWKNCVRFLKESESPHELAVPPLGVFPKELKGRTQTGICTSTVRAVHSQLPKGEAMRRVCVIYACGGKSFSLKKGRNTDTCSAPCKPRGHDAGEQAALTAHALLFSARGRRSVQGAKGGSGERAEPGWGRWGRRTS